MTDDNATARRYFVTVTAPNRDALRELGQRGLDLFAPTAAAGADAATIDGHLSVEAILELVDGGHTVTMHGAAEPPPMEVAESLQRWAADQGIELPDVAEYEK